MGASCSPPISHLLLRLPKLNHKTLAPPNPTTTKKPLFIVVSSSASPLTLQRRQLLLLSLPISLLSCSSGSAVVASVFDPLTDAERAASLEVSRRVAEAVELLEKGREFQAQGDYVQALQYFTQASIGYSGEA
ncbi:hypothetical protein Hdeb2414_s0031g00709551 [Helianthus debilis subsp. tardiflorus]